MFFKINCSFISLLSARLSNYSLAALSSYLKFQVLKYSECACILKVNKHLHFLAIAKVPRCAVNCEVNHCTCQPPKQTFDICQFQKLESF